MGQCNEAFITEEVTKVWAYLPTLRNILKEKGDIPEKDCFPFGMSDPKEHGKRGRDDLVLNRRRFCLLTHPSLIKREADKVVQKEAVAVEKAGKGFKRKAGTEADGLAPKPDKRARKNAPLVEAVIVPPGPVVADASV